MAGKKMSKIQNMVKLKYSIYLTVTSVILKNAHGSQPM